jgi:hypothetical protein
MTGFALAADDQPRAPRVSPPSRLAIDTPGATTRSSASLISEHLRSWIPLVNIAAGPRAPRRVLPLKAPPAPEPLPAIYSAALPAPEKPLFEQAARLAATPAPALLPHIPNLLPTSKRALRQSGNPVIQPAAPISTPPVCNLNGTADLPPLPPFAREIQIEIAPQPAPIPFDQPPYLQSAAAPDDLDLPATIDIPAPVRSKME